MRNYSHNAIISHGFCFWGHACLTLQKHRRFIMNKLVKLTAGIVLAMAFTLTACGGGSAPEEVAEKYMKAALNSDYGTMKKLSSEKNKGSVEKEEEAFKAKGIPPEKKEFFDKMKALTPKAAESANISEDGNSTTVKVSLLDKDGKKGKDSFDLKVKLVKENDAWKVDGTAK